VIEAGGPGAPTKGDDGAFHTELLRPEVKPESPLDALIRRRWIILGVIFLVTVINFVDRQTLSQLAPVICQTFHLNNVQYGRIAAAFQFGMLSGEFPMGYIMDRWGVRLGLSFAVFWWSIATGAQVFARNGLQFGMFRYWMGTGECGNYSGGVKTLTSLFSRKDRTLALGIFNSGSVIGSMIAPPVIVFLLTRYGFRIAFLVPALAGMVWVPLWWFIYGREPKQEEVTYTSHISLLEMLRSPESWAIMMTRFFVGPVMQFYWIWMPKYLHDVQGMPMKELGWVCLIPYGLGGLGGVAGGWAASVLYRRGISTVKVRKILMYGGGVLCLASALVPIQHATIMVVTAISVAIFADNVVSAHMFGAITDLFPDEQAGRATGLTGLSGGLSGLLFPLLTGWLVDRVSYTPVFLLVGIMPLIGSAMLFLLSQRYRNWNKHLSSLTA